jgi:hypothetical protein
MGEASAEVEGGGSLPMVTRGAMMTRKSKFPWKTPIRTIPPIIQIEASPRSVPRCCSNGSQVHRADPTPSPEIPYLSGANEAIVERVGAWACGSIPGPEGIGRGGPERAEVPENGG